MNIDDPQIIALRAKVKAAQEEFDQATAFHEVWKVAAYDTDVHARMGRSFATGAFNTILTALRRELLMGLMRLWDSNSGALSLSNVANILDDKRIIDTLVQECEQHWGNLPETVITNLGDSDDAAILAAFQESERSSGRAEGEKLRERVAKASVAIRGYAPNGAKHETVRFLKGLRDRHFAHRQLKPADTEGPTPDDKAIEQFYQDMARVVRLLLNAVMGTDYRPDETAEINRKHAKLFWAGVRGERTEGHPDYKSLPSKPAHNLLTKPPPA